MFSKHFVFLIISRVVSLRIYISRARSGVIFSLFSFKISSLGVTRCFQMNFYSFRSCQRLRGLSNHQFFCLETMEAKCLARKTKANSVSIFFSSSALLISSLLITHSGFGVERANIILILFNSVPHERQTQMEPTASSPYLCL